MQCKWLVLGNGVCPGITVIDQGARYAYLNGTSMSSPHAAGVAALVKGMHPDWSPGDVKAAVQRSAQQLSCPPDWEPLSDADERERCYGKNGRTSFFGHGLIDAAAAAAVEESDIAGAALDGADHHRTAVWLPIISR